MSDGGGNSDRDAQGRFARGNAGGPGGARRRAFLFRDAAEEAVSTEHVRAMMRRATRMALEGNLAAMRLVLDRVGGRPADAPVETEPLGIALPRLRTAADCNLAIERLVDGICQGTVNHDVARLLVDAIQARLKAIEINEHAERLEQLEEVAKRMEEKQR